MKIGIITNNFLNLIGALDFLKSLINSLDAVRKDRNLELFVFIEEGNYVKEYKKYKGLKRLFYKIKYLRTSKKNYSILTTHPKFSEFKNLKFVIYPCSFLTKTLKKEKIDCFFPHMDASLFKETIPGIGYLYDCQHHYLPQFFKPKEIEARNYWFQSMIDGGPCIVNAHAVKKDLIKFYHAKAENIFVLPLTPKVKTDFLKNHSKEIEQYHLPKRYLMSSNQFWMHKDHTTLFKAFAILTKDKKYADVELVCTGTLEDTRNPTYIDDLKELIKKLGIENKVHLLGLIPKAHQLEMIKGSLGMIQTTLFEGGACGGSVQDACALGIPSIASDIPVNLELKDKLVKFFKTKDANDLAQKMKKLINTPHTPYSEQTARKKTVENTKRLGNALVDIFETVIKKKGI